MYVNFMDLEQSHEVKQICLIRKDWCISCWLLIGHFYVLSSHHWAIILTGPRWNTLWIFFLKESNLQETDLFFALLVNFRPIKSPLLSDLDCGGCQSLYIGLDSILACRLIWRVIWNSIKKFQTFQELYNGKICLLWNLRYGFNNFYWYGK